MTNLEWNDLDRRLVDTARVLAADAVHRTGNGHPGTAMGMAPVATLLFQRYLRHDPADPHWRGRDRFVLSAGHASLLLYIQLYLSGYGLTLDDLKAFRTADSLTPGHPEYGLTPGVETTTGPLGQGLSTAVGMAMEQRFIRGMLDAGATPGESPFDYNIWVIAGDGCLEEGITSEASSQAGHQQLGNLVVIYDDNHITIEGNTDVTFSENVEMRYRAYGWHTLHVDLSPNGSVDIQALARAMDAARAEIHRPTLIRVRSIIGWPAPTKQNTAAAHGSDLGAAEVAAVKEILGFDPDRSFQVDEELLAYARSVMLRGRRAHQEWNERLDSWRESRPANAALFDRIAAQRLPEELPGAIPVFDVGGSISTRVASGQVINAIAAVMPEFWGGSADLAGSNETSITGGGSFEPEGSMVPGASVKGRIIHFGIREHAMGAALNGIALDGLSRVYGGTFFVFSDYMRGSVRLSALMDIPVTYVWTHDSIGLGEDGPTHQPIEHLAALRAMPNLRVIRPADGNETAQAWLAVLEQRRPVGLVLSRQNLPILPPAPAESVARGGYVRAETPAAQPDVILIATGSEVSLALAAAEQLAGDDITARVVSMPCVEWFDAQDDDYRESVLPSTVPARVSVEAGATMPWYRFLGSHGIAIGIDHFGESAAGPYLMEKFGFTVDHVVRAAKKSLAAAGKGEAK